MLHKVAYLANNRAVQAGAVAALAVNVALKLAIGS